MHINAFSKQAQLFTLFLLLVLSAISIGQGIHNAMQYSQDFMWSPAVLFSNHKNPFDIYVFGNPNKEIILTQKPNYLHFIYILVSPLSALSWNASKLLWGITNTLIGVANCILVAKIFNLNTAKALIVAALFFCSAPFRNGVGNGQQQELVLFLFLSGFYVKNNYLAGILTGLSFFKYSFTPPIGLSLFLMRGWRSAAVSIVVNIILILVFSYWVWQNPVHVAIGPFLVSSLEIPTGAGDIMSLVKMLSPVHSGSVYKSIFYGIPLTVSLIICWLLFKRCTNHAEFIAYVALTSLTCFFHLSYDYIFLLPLAVLGIERISSAKGKIIVAGVFYSWYLQRIVYPYDLNGILFILQLGFNWLLLATAWMRDGEETLPDIAMANPRLAV